ncbi:hypothetical protein SLE2022_141750 [Rubroshorea leprosula]
MLRLPTIFVPIQGKPLEVYLSTSDKAVSALVAQDDQEGKEQPVYYRLRHYFLAHKIQLITKSQPIRYLLTRPMLIGHLANWLLQLSQYDITCINPITIKGQVVVDMLSEFSSEIQYPISDEVLGGEVVTAQKIEEKLTLYFDGSSTVEGARAGVVLRDDKGHDTVFSFKLDFQCMNNTAEYKAYLIGLAMAKEAGMQHLKIIGDSGLILRQVQGTFDVREKHLAPYRSSSQYLE